MTHGVDTGVVDRGEVAASNEDTASRVARRAEN